MGDNEPEIGQGVVIKGEVRFGKNVKIGNYSVLEGDSEHPTVINDGTTIGNFVTICSGVEIGEGSKIDDRVMIGHPTKQRVTGSNPSDIAPLLKEFENLTGKTSIGKNAVIRAGTTIYSDVSIGRNFNSGHNAIVREHIVIGNNCIVGGQTEMDGYTTVGDGTIISELVVTCQAMRIGSGVFLAGFLSFSENKYSLPGSITYGPNIKDYVRVGTGTSILADVAIGELSIIGAHSLVTKSVPEKSVAYGLPAAVVRRVTDEEIDEYVSRMKKKINAP